MLIVFVAFFQVLGLTAITEPLNGFLNQVFQYAPRILAAVVLVFLAWFSATLIRLLVQKGLTLLRLDERLSEHAQVSQLGTVSISAEAAEKQPASSSKKQSGKDADEEEPEPGKPPAVAGPPLPLTKTIAGAAYWLVWLLFIPAILSVLNLPGNLAPMQELVGDILGFLPNLLAAAAILALGWFVARILQRLTTNLLAALGVDRLSERVGISHVIGDNRLSTALGVLVHNLVLLPVIITALNALDMAAVTAPASEMLNRILTALPNIFAAILVIGLAYVIGRLVSGLVSNLLQQIGFDRLSVRLGLTKKEPKDDKRKPSYIAGVVVMVAIILVSARCKLCSC